MPVVPPADLYLKFLHLELIESSVLQFANRFGTLGVPGTHFHSKDCREVRGEDAGIWGFELGRFQHWFEVWQSAERRNLIDLRKLLVEAGVPLDNERFNKALTRDLVRTAKSHVVNEINRVLRPGISMHLPAYQGCFFEGCSYRNKFARITEHVSCQLKLREKQGRISVQTELVPETLLTTVWLQFAHLVCGGRRIRQCDICGQWMDISETSRPGAKRMHARCSLAQRMRKWRSKRKN